MGGAQLEKDDVMYFMTVDQSEFLQHLNLNLLAAVCLFACVHITV